MSIHNLAIIYLSTNFRIGVINTIADVIDKNAKLLINTASDIDMHFVPQQANTNIVISDAQIHEYITTNKSLPLILFSFIFIVL
jgi:hypothetical protein